MLSEESSKLVLNIILSFDGVQTISRIDDLISGQHCVFDLQAVFWGRGHASASIGVGKTPRYIKRPSTTGNMGPPLQVRSLCPRS